MSARLAATDGVSRWYAPALLAAFAVGIAVRAVPVLRHPFPLNDGGLFYEMARELQASSYLLPRTTGYNEAGIPFAYPPLGFYVTALLDQVTPLDLFDAFRLVPLIATCLTLFAFFRLARGLLTRGNALVAALLAFALIPRSAIWLLMGGGTTRSFGLLFALLALEQVRRMYVERSWRELPLALLLCTLTVLSHLETGWFLAFSIGLFWLAFGRHRRGVLTSVVLASGTVLLTAPWWGTVLAYHGPEPFIAAAATGGSIFSDAETRTHVLLAAVRITATSEPFFPLIGMLGLLGVVAALASGRWLLPVWWLLIVLLEARAYPTFSSIPVAMLAGIGVTELLVPAVMSVASPRGVRAARWAGVGVVAALLLYTVPSAFITKRGLAGEGGYLVSLSGDEREAMRWVAEQTPPSARFLLVTGEGWATDKTSEWFPVLAERVSVATVQGKEWLPEGAFEHSEWAFEQVHECGYRTADCLAEWSEEIGADFDYVYIPVTPGGQCCWTLVTSLESDPGYTVVYDGDGATIFARDPGPAVQRAR